MLQFSHLPLLVHTCKIGCMKIYSSCFISQQQLQVVFSLKQNITSMTAANHQHMFFHTPFWYCLTFYSLSFYPSFSEIRTYIQNMMLHNANFSLSLFFYLTSKNLFLPFNVFNILFQSFNCLSHTFICKTCVHEFMSLWAIFSYILPIFASIDFPFLFSLTSVFCFSYILLLFFYFVYILLYELIHGCCLFVDSLLF